MSNFVCNPMPEQLEPKLRERLAACQTGTFGHFLDNGFMRSGISQKSPRSRVAGTAITVRSPFPDSVIGHYALRNIRPGDILVIDRGDNQSVACWGGTTSFCAAALGLSALIVDGVCNDIDEANEFGLPIWCDGVTPITTKYRGIGGSINEPIQCGGVIVNPGDAVLADENGVLVLPRENLSSAIDDCEAFFEKEMAFREQYKGQGPYPVYPDLTGASNIVEESS